MKNILVLLAMYLSMYGCSAPSVDAGHEGVLVYKPFFFGHGSVDQTPVTTGRVITAWSTSLYEYSLRPYRLEEVLENAMTADNRPVTLNAYVLLRVLPGRAPELHQKFGEEFYKNVLQEKFRTMVRQYCKSIPMFDLAANEKSLIRGQELLTKELKTLVAEQGLPINIDAVILGAVRLPEDVLEETSRTAAQQQRELTEAARAKAELARKAAEGNKALADREYMTQLQLTADQYIRIRQVEIEKEKVELVRGKDNVHIIMNSGGGGVLPTFGVE